MNPYDQPHPPAAAPPPGPRSFGNRLVRVAALVLLPPIAAVWLWGSRRLNVTAKVLLTVWCAFASLIWLGVIIGPTEKDAATPGTPSVTPTATVTATATASVTATVTATPSPVQEEAPTAAPTPTPTPEPVAPTTPPPAPPVAATTPPAPAAPAAPQQNEASQGGGGGSAYYANCTAAKAAGAAPLYRGEPGYRSGLDRDGDGIACEK